MQYVSLCEYHATIFFQTFSLNKMNVFSCIMLFAKECHDAIIIVIFTFEFHLQIL
jgi:hypothetical protein